MRERSLGFARDDLVGFGVMVCIIGDILLGVAVWGGGVIQGLFHLPRLDLRRLYPFDSLRSLRVTAVGRVSSKKVSEEDCHPERRVEVFRHP